jgi:hypothetical protein
MKRIIVDHREPSWLVGMLKKQASKLGFEVEILKGELRSYDVVFSLHGKIVIGVEIKRIESDDFKRSLIEGKIKHQVEPFKDRNNFSYLSIIGDLSFLSNPISKAVFTLKAELDMIGVKTDLFPNDTRFAFHFIRLCQFYTGEKAIRFPAFCETVKTDDSPLTKMLKQWYGMGDGDSEYFGKNYLHFLDMLFPEKRLSKIRNLFTGNESLQLSNELRAHKGKPAQKKPLQKIDEWVRWFVHGEIPKKKKKK